MEVNRWSKKSPSVLVIVFYFLTFLSFRLLFSLFSYSSLSALRFSLCASLYILTWGCATPLHFSHPGKARNGTSPLLGWSRLRRRWQGTWPSSSARAAPLIDKVASLNLHVDAWLLAWFCAWKIEGLNWVWSERVEEGEDCVSVDDLVGGVESYMQKRTHCCRNNVHYNANLTLFGRLLFAKTDSGTDNSISVMFDCYFVLSWKNVILFLERMYRLLTIKKCSLLKKVLRLAPEMRAIKSILYLCNPISVNDLY